MRDDRGGSDHPARRTRCFGVLGGVARASLKRMVDGVETAEGGTFSTGTSSTSAVLCAVWSFITSFCTVHFVRPPRGLTTHAVCTAPVGDSDFRNTFSSVESSKICGAERRVRLFEGETGLGISEQSHPVSECLVEMRWS